MVVIKGGGPPYIFLGERNFFYCMDIKCSKVPLIGRSKEVPAPLGAKVMGLQNFGAAAPNFLKWSQRNETGVIWKVLEH